MTKKEHIQYWVTTAEKDWKVVYDLYEAKNYVYALFFAHLVIEKLAKAIWVKNNEGDHPPRVHNVVYLLERANTIINDDQKKFLLIFNDFQLEGRYPDYKQKIFEICTKAKTNELLEKVKEIKQWMLKQL